MHQPTPGISVLICTYNGAGNLPDTMKHLSAQRVAPELAWEIILVNNASTDDTAAVAGQLSDELFPEVSFTIADEPRPGKDRAMDKGLALARYAYVLVCDDDNWFAADYVQAAFEVMSANPRIGMLGGRATPVFESTPPAWFGEVANFYAVGEQNPQPGEVTTSKGFLWGAGAVINLAAYRRLLGAGFERIITFADYPDIARGEDVELCLAIKLAGYKIWYDPRLSLQHHISEDKLSWPYVVKLAREGGRIATIIGMYKAAIRQNGVTYGGKHRWLGKLARQLLNPQFLRLWWNVKTKNREGSRDYLRNVAALGHALSYLEYKSRFDLFTKKIFQLKSRLQPASTR